MQILMTDKDIEILNKYDDSCRARAMLELAIVDCLIDEAKKTGHILKIIDDEKYEEDKEDIYYDEDIKDLLFNLDEAIVYIFEKESDEPIGSIFLVFGNYGYDLISDYSTKIENFLAPVLELSKKLGA